jgi:CspA family cold shock protein
LKSASQALSLLYRFSAWWRGPALETKPADDLLQTSIDPAPRMRAFFWNMFGETTWLLELWNGLMVKRAFGLVQPDNGGADVFVHISAVERAGLRGLAEGQKLSYEITQDNRSGKSSADQLKEIWGTVVAAA